MTAAEPSKKKFSRYILYIILDVRKISLRGKMFYFLFPIPMVLVIWQPSKCEITVLQKNEQTKEEKTWIKTIKLYDTIHIESSHSKIDRFLTIYLTKKKPKNWPTLSDVKDTKILIDWPNWKYIDDSDDGYIDIPFNLNMSDTLSKLNIEETMTSDEIIDTFELSSSDTDEDM